MPGIRFAGVLSGDLVKSSHRNTKRSDLMNGLAMAVESYRPGNRKETEYILIGTLLSFAFALVVGLAVKGILRNLP